MGLDEAVKAVHVLAAIVGAPTGPSIVCDEQVRTEGQLVGRFLWVENNGPNNGGDWWPDDSGTHHGYLWRNGFHCLKIGEEG